MAFSFGTSLNAPPPASPIERRSRTLVQWSDSAVTIDTWLVELYDFRPDGTVSSNPVLEAYVRPYNTNNNVATIDVAEYVERVVTVDAFAVFTTETLPVPATDDVAVFYAGTLGYQFQVYSVTNGVKSSLQGSFNYIPMNYAKKQKWNWEGGYESIFDYYPDFGTKKGWLTDREGASYIRYDMAVEDQGVVNALYLGNYDYEYETGENTNNANWDQVRYQVYYNNSVENILLLDKPADSNNFDYSTFNIPIGPANINDNPNWTISYDLTTEPWDYIKIELIKTSGSKCKEIRVYPDCRPQKHTPAQLCWMGTKGYEMLRFDGRVNDNYDVSGRDNFQVVNQYYNGRFSGQDYFSQGNRFLAEVSQQEAEGKRSFSLSEDFFTQAERELFKTAITSSIMLVRYEDKWYPCTLKTTNYTHVQASSRLAPIRLEVEVSQALLC